MDVQLLAALDDVVAEPAAPILNLEDMVIVLIICCPLAVLVLRIVINRISPFRMKKSSLERFSRLRWRGTSRKSTRCPSGCLTAT